MHIGGSKRIVNLDKILRRMPGRLLIECLVRLSDEFDNNERLNIIEASNRPFYIRPSSSTTTLLQSIN